MGRHENKPAHPDVIAERTHPSNERCDRSAVERARWWITSPSGSVITLCNYHYRQHDVALAMDGWHAEEIKEEDG